jgi:hypothetical protein
MLRLFGQSVDSRDADNLAVALLADGRPDAMSAAVAIDSSLRSERPDIELTDAQLVIVADVVENHPRSLSKLKSLLAGE